VLPLSRIATALIARLKSTAGATIHRIESAPGRL
jgi:hypothetical protein